MNGQVYAQPFEFKRTQLRGTATEVRIPGLSSPVSSLSVSRNRVAVFELLGADFSTVVAIDRSGRIKNVIAPLGPYANLALSPEGNELVIAQGTEALDLWLHNLRRGTVSRLTSHPAADGVPVWSPDASQVAFASWRDGGDSNLYVKRVHGSAPETRLLASHGNKYPTDWSRDGGYLMYQEAAVGTGWDLWVLRTDRLANGTAPQVYLKTDWNEQDGRFSPDGRWVAYASDEGGRTEVYVRAFPTGERKWQVSSGGGGKPVWRSDGRELYFLSADGRMMAVSVKPGPTFSASEPKPLFPATASFNWFGGVFAADAVGETFYIMSTPASSRRNVVTVMLNWRPDVN